MAFQGQKSAYRVIAGLFGLSLLILAAPPPASAGFFDTVINGFRRAVGAPDLPQREPGRGPAYTDPFTSLANRITGDMPQQELEHLRPDARGPQQAFCVRTCDGRYFPVQAHAGLSAAESCHSFCPASETRLYGGSNIDSAVAANGSRYAGLPAAFAYRKALVAGCTCNGRTAFGLAPIDIARDPTLRPGDIVATPQGIAAYTVNRNNVGEFTPVRNYGGLAKDTRDRLAQTRVGPMTTVAATNNDITGSILPAATSPQAANARAEPSVR
jgi:hypothetical protein